MVFRGRQAREQAEPRSFKSKQCPRARPTHSRRGLSSIRTLASVDLWFKSIRCCRTTLSNWTCRSKSRHLAWWLKVTNISNSPARRWTLSNYPRTRLLHRTQTTWQWTIWMLCSQCMKTTWKRQTSQTSVRWWTTALAMKRRKMTLCPIFKTRTLFWQTTSSWHREFHSSNT